MPGYGFAIVGGYWKCYPACGYEVSSKCIKDGKYFEKCEPGYALDSSNKCERKCSSDQEWVSDGFNKGSCKPIITNSMAIYIRSAEKIDNQIK